MMLQSQQLQSKEIGELVKALVAVQASIKHAEFDANNKFLKNKYATLESISRACRKELATNNIAVIQAPIKSEGGVGIRTTLAHISGQWTAGEVHIKTEPQKGVTLAQVIGSAISYGRRYGLASMVGVLTGEDDDGNLGQDPRQQQPQKPVQQQQPQQQPNGIDYLLKMKAPNQQWASEYYSRMIQKYNGDQNQATKELYDMFNANFFYDPAQNNLIQKL